ncbi:MULTISPECIES: carbohydrate ABC transporter permease [unclassified Oceanispirochaeta]|uniref:carbohydrate ABC transporter permease n=1 Tax=unclassified Oceanispirochaeta TaxID=2635722 RepID=UPI000E093143|nr:MULTISPECIES: sugar ABC transporter permease [unclassified Oceanispirochaeta]MBF9016500.1 sugar ABC transporter permease [Oceanispirochaeta sp. M2]NPD72962.1 sugar ABC transporter permease [Oceanispirochaeta sp. M1]RDG31306.1 sugar ABC transporter permease [Oceanispirochaeta sp. M1]
MNNKNALYPGKLLLWTLLAPGVLLYVGIAIIPIFNAIILSFYKWSGGDSKTFLGFGNYVYLITDPLFWGSLKNNLLIGVISIIGQVGIALILAALFTSRDIKFVSFHRSVIFFPVVLAAIIIGFIWTMVYSREYGLLNFTLKGLGLEGFIRAWLDDPSIIILSVSAPIVWQYIGYYTVIIASGITAIPSEIFESAELDGAVGWRKLFYIIYPLIKNTIVVCVMMCIAGSMKIFTHILVMTGGGPGNSSMVMSMYAYRNSFIKYKLGYGSAASIGILLVSMMIILLTRSLMGSKNEEQF